MGGAGFSLAPYRSRKTCLDIGKVAPFLLSGANHRISAIHRVGKPKDQRAVEKKREQKLSADTSKIKGSAGEGVPWGKPASTLAPYGITEFALVPVYIVDNDDDNDIYFGFQYADTDRKAFDRFMDNAVKREASKAKAAKTGI